MKKLFAVAVATLVVVGLAFGQGMPAKGQSSLGIAGELSIPTASNFKDFSSMGYGGSGRYQYGLEKNVTLYGSVGYVSWPSKEEVAGLKIKFSALEFMAGGKYGFGGGLYGLAELGISSFTVSTSGTVLGVPFDFSESESKFMLAPGLGFAINGVTVEAKYFLLDSDFANIRFRVGYDFGL
jgi:hypothetical protein